MPRTKLQSVVFTTIMVFIMVFSMTCYTVAPDMGGLSRATFGAAIKEMWLEYAVVWLLIFFVISPAALKLTFRMFTPGADRPIFIILSIQSLTVSMIVPTITLFATFAHGGFTADWFTRWLTTWVTCFPMALCLQLFYAGPLVRFIFRKIFPEK